MTDPATLAAAGLAPSAPTSVQWPAYQALGEQLAAAGAQGVLYCSAARPAGQCVCAFATALDGLAPLDRVRVHAPPAPPAGMRTRTASVLITGDEGEVNEVRALQLLADRGGETVSSRPLAAFYGFSSHSRVRPALARLQGRGLVDQRDGVGTSPIRSSASGCADPLRWLTG